MKPPADVETAQPQTVAPSKPHTAEHPVALSHDGQPILFPKLPFKGIHTRAKGFLADENIQAFVNNATLLKDNSRKTYTKKIFGDKHDDLRSLAAKVKQHTLDNLDYYLEQFVKNATAAGSIVHFADTARQANDICLDIAKREKLSLCVKGKSMVTEETHLLPELEAIGVETVETDLGEFIIQLDNDAPSHIVTPMIHKNRASVGRAFERCLGVPYTEDPQTLTSIAREHLRKKFRVADLGITGGNFCVASTGTVAICTNEGNGRLSSSRPRVHVIFVGIEKLVPDTPHLALMLKMLTRHSTGQPLTVYTHLMTGPRREHEHDGPEQQHIILVNNGRTNILRDEEFRSALRCIRCGACLNSCPVYRKATGHAYGAVYSGPIGAVITPLLKGLDNYKDLPNASSLCGACYEACPVKIDLPKLLIKLRRDANTRHISTTGERLLYKLMATGLTYPAIYKMGGIFQRNFMHLLADRDGFIAKAPGPFSAWTQQRDLPAPARRNFRQWWKQHQKESKSR